MKYYLPTYQECLDICEKHGELAFYETKSVVDGYNISTFNYRLVGFNHFNNPLDNHVKAFELRGLTFVFNEDGSIYNRYLMLHKFFNLNQVESTQAHLFKDKEISFLMNKEDGSLVSFIRLPNGRVLPKTKIGLSNEQTQMCEEIYDNDESLRKAVDWSLDNGYVLLFELVSPFNKIVLSYNKTELILLWCRSLETGEYYNVYDFKEFEDLNKVKLEEKKTLPELIELTKTITDKEGWVINIGESLLKLKTLWYYERHDLFTEHIYREDYLIDMIIKDTIDDVVSQLDINDTEIRDKIEKTKSIIFSYINETSEDIDRLISIFEKDFSSDRKNFSIEFRRDKHFHLAIKCIDGYDKVELIKEFILKKTYFLENAKKFIDKGGF